MKKTDLNTKDNKGKNKDLQELREKLRVLKFNLSAGKVKNVREVRKIKKDIARLLTSANPKSIK